VDEDGLTGKGRRKGSGNDVASHYCRCGPASLRTGQYLLSIPENLEEEVMSVRGVVIEGVKMNWQQRGDGPPVILLHGLPTSPLLWRYVMPRLDGYRAYAWELPGYASSHAQAAMRDISVSKQADYLLAWMKSLEIDRAVLVGHDIGGGVAQIAATRNPGAVRGLVLCNSVCYDNWPIAGVRFLQVLAPLNRETAPGRFAPALLLRDGTGACAP
jgi:pimeloyl-ACP methyl ester carboxylesterase